MIDEQLLIERLEETRWTTIFDTTCIFENDKLDKCIKIINQLAEESKECYKDCGQCEGYDKEKHYCPKWCSVVRDTVEELKESNNGWIPCENELPKEYTDVLGCDYNGHIYVLQLYKDSIFGNIWRQWNGGLLRLDVIVAWQPLPAPFKPDRK